jgi:hypothetical protein
MAPVCRVWQDQSSQTGNVAVTSRILRVNLKAAKAFGLSILESFPLLADEVIE